MQTKTGDIYKFTLHEIGEEKKLDIYFDVDFTEPRHEHFPVTSEY